MAVLTDIVAEVRDLRAYYVTEAFGVRRTVRAVEGVSVDIRKDEVFGIAGESGCGKSTLLKALLGMTPPPLTILGGSVIYRVGGGEVDVLALPEAKRRLLRWQAVSYIPQGSMHALNPVRRIRDTFRDFIRAHRRLGGREADALVRDYLGNLGLPAKVLDSYPHQLSGGMRQRVTIALATILAPPLVLADEPTTALDVVVQRAVLQFLDEVRKRQASTLVLVTHDMGVHANVTDRIAVLYAGQVAEEAGTRTLFARPLHPYTQYLIQSLPKLDDKGERLSIPGRPPALDAPPSGCRFHPRCPYAMAVCRTAPPPLVSVGPDHRVACYLVSGREGDGSRP
jgi:peptide/nickel transport system ATP-binding protein